MKTNETEKNQRQRAGRPPKLAGDDLEALLELVREKPWMSLEETAEALRRETDINVCTATIRSYLKQAGFVRVRPSKKDKREAERESPESEGAEARPRKYGYHSAHRHPGDEDRYPSCLADSEWEQVKHLFDPPGRPGRPEIYPRRQILDACIYVLRSGCSWRMLPKDFPPWQSVYKTFRRWSAQGLFEAMYDMLRKQWRMHEQRQPDPSAMVVDSQSVRTSAQGGPAGFDAGKKIKGRKRHLVTDTLGLLLAVMVTTACVQDRDAAVPVVDLAMAKAPGLKMLYADSGYAGKVRQDLQQRHDIEVEIVRHPRNRNVGRWQENQLPLFKTPKGFVVLPKRWVVERTNAWNDRPRRMNKDHDRNLGVSTAWIWLTEARILLRRLVSGALNLC